MARRAGRSKSNDADDRLPRLVVSRDEAAKRIQERIALGEDLRRRVPHSASEFEQVGHDMEAWGDFNEDLLMRIFDSPRYRNQYAAVGMVSIPINPSPQRLLEHQRERVADRVGRLRSVLDRLALVEEIRPTPPEAPTAGQVRADGVRRVFVVHGHDDGMRETVARFIEKLDLDPVVLLEQPNAGRTLVEKFEAHADVGFAVVLLTPDDEGRAAETTEPYSRRARQNVILELGYFIGRLGRSRVCALHKGNVELPSDIHGVLWVALDDAGAWRLRLAREIKAIGIDVDLNSAM